MCVCIHANVCIDVYVYSYKQEYDIACAKVAAYSYKSGIVPFIGNFSLSLAMMTERSMISLKWA